MNYQEAIEVFFTKLPMFQRSGPAAYKVNLDGAKAVSDLLGNPEDDLKFIHIAGTNGKGTVAHMLSAIFQKAGFKVGLFTSPHLIDFRERIRINGKLIEESYVLNFVRSYHKKWGEPSFFELTFGMALDYFKFNKVDIVILETGMGGRLDSTNIINTAEVCVVTNVGLDHQQFLGDTIRKIAAEKAGILKNGVPVVLGKMRPEAQSVVLERAMKTSSDMFYGKNVPKNLNSDPSPFFEENAATAFETARVLSLQGWSLDPERAVNAINNYRNISGQRGRAELIPSTIDLGSLIVDCAHNYDGIKGFISSLSGELHIVFGAVVDKDPTLVLSLIPPGSKMYWCQADIVRAMDVHTLSDYGESVGLTGKTYNRVKEAVYAARTATANITEAQAVVFGSVFVVGEII